MGKTLENIIDRQPEKDVLGFEAFIITENYESLFSNLVGVYSRLVTKERFNLVHVPDEEKISNWLKRGRELMTIKSAMVTKPLNTLKELTEEYRPELLKMEHFESVEYDA